MGVWVMDVDVHVTYEWDVGRHGHPYAYVLYVWNRGWKKMMHGGSAGKREVADGLREVNGW